MGKDRISLFVSTVNINSLCNDKHQWKSYSLEDFKNKYEHRMSYYRYGAMVYNTSIFNVNYLRYSKTYGDLCISFSVAKLYNGNNSICKGIISPTDLVKCIKEGLSDVLDMDKLPLPDEWKITMDESNIDMLDTVENLKQRFELLKKIKIPYRRLDSHLADKGTLYFHSGKCMEKSSAKVVIYFKGKEQIYRGNDIHSLMNLNEGSEILRIETKDKRYSLKKKVAKVRTIQESKERAYILYNLYRDLSLYNMSDEYEIKINVLLGHPHCNIIFKEIHSMNCVIFSSDSPIFNSCIDKQFYIKYNTYCNSNIIDTVMSKEYQLTVINDFIKQCGFDKVITTKDKLYKIIERSNIFTKTKKKTAKRVVRFLNQEIYSINLNDRTIESYKKLILSTGYHYLYADKQLNPITVEDILKVIEQEKPLTYIA